jgi:hypothetical protein
VQGGQLPHRRGARPPARPGRAARRLAPERPAGLAQGEGGPAPSPPLGARQIAVDIIIKGPPEYRYTSHVAIPATRIDDGSPARPPGPDRPTRSGGGGARRAADGPRRSALTGTRFGTCAALSCIWISVRADGHRQVWISVRADGRRPGRRPVPEHGRRPDRPVRERRQRHAGLHRLDARRRAAIAARRPRIRRPPDGTGPCSHVKGPHRDTSDREQNDSRKASGPRRVPTSCCSATAFGGRHAAGKKSSGMVRNPMGSDSRSIVHLLRARWGHGHSPCPPVKCRENARVERPIIGIPFVCDLASPRPRDGGTRPAGRRQDASAGQAGRRETEGRPRRRPAMGIRVSVLRGQEARRTGQGGPEAS